MKKARIKVILESGTKVLSKIIDRDRADGLIEVN